LLLLRIL
jgi:hypothetical protein